MLRITAGKCLTKCLTACAMSIALCLVLPQPIQAQDEITFQTWRSRCLATPANRELRGRMPPRNKLPIADFGVVRDMARRLLDAYRTGGLAQADRWLGEKPKDDEFFDIQRSYYSPRPIPFQPFARKITDPGRFQSDFSW